MKVRFILAGLLCWSSVFLVVGSRPVMASPAETPEEHIGRLIKEAVGAQPVRDSGSPAQQAFDQAFRSQYRELIRANRSYESAIKQVDSARIERLSAPESLASPTTAVEGLRQLHLAYDIEVSHERNVQEIYAGLRHIFETAAWAAPIRPRLLKILESTTFSPSLRRQRCIAAEKVWMESMDELYRYASMHTGAVQAVNGEIVISDPIIQQDFNQRILAEETHRRTFLKAKQEYAQMQAQALRRVAVKPKTIGLQ